MEELSYKIKKGNHILIPNNKTSELAQNLTFEFFEKIQYDFILKYDKLDDSQKITKSNEISNFFVTVLLNKDGATFRTLVGIEHKGLMTKEELKNIKRDYNIAIEKKKNHEFKTFLLLDLIPQSNRRADAIIITNDYEIELFDFSEGKIAEKIKFTPTDDLTESEKKQKLRKEKQLERINSYKNQIKSDCSPIKNVVLDGEKTNVVYFELNAEFYDFNFFYNHFKENNYEDAYIPESFCFFLKNKNNKFPFISFPLKHNIDSPLFLTEEKPFIDSNFINDIYEKNIYIGFSLYYAHLFISEFTHFKIHLVKNPQKGMEKNHFSLNIGKKKKFVYLEDSRTNKWVPIGFGILNKHMFMNLNIKSTMIYLSKLCNQDATAEFNNNIIDYDKLKTSPYDFFIMNYK